MINFVGATAPLKVSVCICIKLIHWIKWRARTFRVNACIFPNTMRDGACGTGRDIVICYSFIASRHVIVKLAAAQQRQRQRQRGHFGQCLPPPSSARLELQHKYTRALVINGQHRITRWQFDRGQCAYWPRWRERVFILK